ncbi:MAG: ornithine carbamoyltransferase [Oscillospiraceae bacterium]|nr:ornithine carbamoyltransferase [Oscillospiraceae bacterium]
MKTNMRGRDFVTLQDYTGEEIQTILDTAFELKLQNAMGQPHELLKNKTLGMLFAQPSTRTRVSFETGMTQLGGHAQYYSEDSMQRKNKETWADTGLVLSRYLNALMVRLYDLEEYGMARDIMNEIRNNTTIPVINGLDDKEHPCQCMGDLMVIQEKLGRTEWKKKKIVMSWAYAERVKSPGVPQAMLTACGLLGADITLAYPKGYELDDQYMEFAQNAAKTSGSKISVTNDIYEACEGADIIYAKSWGSTHGMPKGEDQEYRKQFAEDWRISEKHFALANPVSYYMHPLPAARGEEVDDAVIDGPHSIVYDQAENRLHAQKAVLTLLMK